MVRCEVCRSFRHGSRAVQGQWGEVIQAPCVKPGTIYYFPSRG